MPNPSHLEAVDPVVEGRARAEQTDRSEGAAFHDPSVALPVLIHGDAAFPGQGVVAETLNLSNPRGLLDRRHAAPDHEQPGRLHDRPDREPLDAVLERPRQGLRRPDRPRQRRRSRGGAERRSAGARLPGRVRPRLRDRPRRLPALRPQRAGRAGVHAAADGRADPATADRSRGVRRPARRGRRAQRGRGRGDRRRTVTAALRRRTSGCKATLAASHPAGAPTPARGRSSRCQSAVANTGQTRS